MRHTTCHLRFLQTLLIVPCLLGFVADGLAGDWPHWRGPRRNDVTDEPSGWDGARWLPAEPAWSVNNGYGSTSPIVAKGRLYVLGWYDGKDTLLCRDAATGKEIWQSAYRCPEYGRHREGDEGFYSGPSATPEFDPATKLLYTLSIDGDLRCCDTASAGRLVWNLNLYERFGVGKRPRVGRSGRRDYGYTSSPLVRGDALIVEVGDDTGLLMAFDKRTGEPQWTSEATGFAGHTGGPVPIDVGGTPCVAVLAFAGLVVARVDNGKTVAEFPWVTDFANNIASPAVFENSVLITSDYNHGAICKLEITPGKARQIWEQPFSSKVCSPLVHRGKIYWAWQQARCLDWQTGNLAWQGGEFSDPGSCILTSDERLIVWGGNGTLALLETAERSPTGYRELAARRGLFPTDVWPHVVLAHGRLYCKDRLGGLKCFELSQTD